MLNNHEVYILNENVSNSTNNIIIDNVNNNNVNDYIYDQIYVKNKKTTNINKNKNINFRNVPNWTPRISLDEGLQMTWDYIKQKNN